MKIAALHALIALLPALLGAAPVAAQNRAEVQMFRGQCEYSDRFAPLLERGDHSFALCDSATVAGGVFDFRRDSWGSMMRFEGTRSGDRMAIGHVQLRSGSRRAATGACEIFYRDGAVSTIACTAVAGGRTYAANFVPRR
ncbi:hypothetical protein [Parasphingopyxis sp.]|uniref:hypothetical protein n=1 Tax=Parasphingopyxis sp. TaxID=1920299 RepID=UPI003F9F54C4